MQQQHQYIRSIATGLITLIAAVASFGCKSQEVEITNITLQTNIADGQKRLEISTAHNQPLVYRNISCGSESIISDPTTTAEIEQVSGGLSTEMVVEEVDYENQKIVAIVPDNLTVENGEYIVTLHLPLRTSVWKKFSHVADGDSAGSDSAMDVGTATETSKPADTDTTPVFSTDIDSSGNTDTDTSVDTTSGTDTETSPALASPLHIEGECALGRYAGDCNGVVEGAVSNSWDMYVNAHVPMCDSNNCTMVVYMMSASWISFPDLDFTPYDTLTLQVACGAEQGKLDIMLDDPLNGDVVGSTNTWTGGWTTFSPFTVPLEGITGTHTLYIIGGEDNSFYHGNIDWIELSAETFTGDTDREPIKEKCAAYNDCFYGNCWSCANSGPCKDVYKTCKANSECVAIDDCIENNCSGSSTWQACTDECVSWYPAGEADYEAYRQCVLCDVCQSGCTAHYNCSL